MEKSQWFRSIPSSALHMFLRHGTNVDYEHMANCLIRLAQRHSSSASDNLLRCFRAAGLRPNTVLRQFPLCDVKCPDHLCNYEIVRQFLRVEPLPESLRFISRIAIRKQLINVSDGTSILKRIDQLPLPRLLINYLKLSDVIEPEERR